MRIDQSILNIFKSAAIIAAIVLLAANLAPATANSNNTQDINFRLINIERRLDQMQAHLDGLDRAVQGQVVNNVGASNVSAQGLTEVRQQQLLMSQQLLTIQKQMLDMRKEIDRQAGRVSDQGKDSENKDDDKKDDAKPKVQPKKP